MKLAITGGSGFLAYHLCHELWQKYEKISLVDITPISQDEYPPNVAYKNVDVRDFNSLKKQFSDTDTVIHTAAALPLWRKKDILEVNIKGTENVLQAALENNIKKVVHISSTAVYGVPVKHPIEETDPLVGVGPYGESKIVAEKTCEQYRNKGLSVPIVRPKTFIGRARLGVFQILYEWIEEGRKIPIIGNGKNKYQLLEVRDLVKAIDLILEKNDEKINNTFNVGASHFSTVAEDLEVLCQFAKSGSQVLSIPSYIAKPPLMLFEKLNISPLYKWVYGTADKDSFVSTDKITSTLGWIPQYSNQEALIESYKWYLENKPSLKESTGVTHRTPWKQGILNVFKKFL